MIAAVGVSVHTAWVIAVTVANPSEPTFVDRRRIELVADDLPKQAYHAAVEAGMDVEDAASLIEAWSLAAAASCTAALAEMRAATEAYDLRQCAICGRPRRLPSLPSILRSHPLLHAGEGQLSLEAVGEGARAAGLAVTYLDPDALPAAATRAAVELRRTAGPPWAADHKRAAAAAIGVLSQ